jgi:hypothetical protein
VTDAERAEREDLLAGLDVLAGLAACFAAMDERERLPIRPRQAPPRTFRRWDRVSGHWIDAA